MEQGDIMTLVNDLMEKVEENARMKAALEYLKADYLADKERGYGNDGAKTALVMAGLLREEDAA